MQGGRIGGVLVIPSLHDSNSPVHSVQTFFVVANEEGINARIH